MKKLNMLMMACALLFLACSDDDGDASDDTFFECTVDGEEFRTTGIWAYAVKFSTDNTISIYGNKDALEDDYQLCYISLEDNGRVGSYDLGTANTESIGFVYYNENNESYTSNLESGDGTLEITSIDDEGLEGTFSYDSFDGNGNKREVRDGKFRVEFQ